MEVNTSVYTNKYQDEENSRIKEAHEENKVNKDEDMFMILFLKELEMQDPLEPVSNSEMLSQMASFNQLTELQSINEKLSTLGSNNSLAEASNLIGKNITGINEDSENESGVVDSVNMKEGNIFVKAGGSSFKLEDIISVTSVDVTA